jgi:hypothetical protein
MNLYKCQIIGIRESINFNQIIKQEIFQSENDIKAIETTYNIVLNFHNTEKEDLGYKDFLIEFSQSKAVKSDKNFTIEAPK